MSIFSLHQDVVERLAGVFWPPSHNMASRFFALASLTETPESLVEMERILSIRPSLSTGDVHAGLTGLMLAAENGNFGMIERLLPFSDPMAKDAHGRSALLMALHNISIPMPRLQAIFEALFPVSDASAPQNNGITPLMLAAWAGHSSIVAALVQRADPNATSSLGMTALMSAASMGRFKCVEVLLPLSDASAIDDRGLDAAFMARMNGHLGIEAYILSFPLARQEREELDAASRPSAKASSAPGPRL